MTKRLAKFPLLVSCLVLLSLVWGPSFPLSWQVGAEEAPPETLPIGEAAVAEADPQEPALPLDEDLAGEDPEEEGEGEDRRSEETTRLEFSDQEWSEMVSDVPRPVEAWPSLDQIACAAYIVADGDTGEILLGENTDAIAYPASMTKIMTALVILEHPDYDPAKPIYFSDLACAMPAPESTTAGFMPGEICPTISCLYAMIMRSANDVANALAENYGGTIDDFVVLMNQKAQELGCENTNFLDPCGFGYVDHHTTCEDMVKIIRRAMSHSLFQSLVSNKLYSLPPTNLHPMSGWSNIVNGNFLVTYSDGGWGSPWLASFDGIKAGMTDIAGDCLATAATTYDGRHLIAVIFDAAYTGEYPNSYVGSAIMSHTLLEEGAKAMGAPRKDEAAAYEPGTYPWPTMADPLLGAKAAAAAQENPLLPSEPLPSFTVIPPEPPLADQQTVAENEIVVGRLPLFLIFLGFSVCLTLTLILAYQLHHKKKQDRIRRRYEERHY